MKPPRWLRLKSWVGIAVLTLLAGTGFSEEAQLPISADEPAIDAPSSEAADAETLPTLSEKTQFAPVIKESAVPRWFHAAVQTDYFRRTHPSGPYNYYGTQSEDYFLSSSSDPSFRVEMEASKRSDWGGFGGAGLQLRSASLSSRQLEVQILHGSVGYDGQIAGVELGWIDNRGHFSAGEFFGNYLLTGRRVMPSAMATLKMPILDEEGTNFDGDASFHFFPEYIPDEALSQFSSLYGYELNHGYYGALRLGVEPKGANWNAKIGVAAGRTSGQFIRYSPASGNFGISTFLSAQLPLKDLNYPRVYAEYAWQNVDLSPTSAATVGIEINIKLSPKLKHRLVGEAQFPLVIHENNVLAGGDSGSPWPTGPDFSREPYHAFYARYEIIYDNFTVGAAASNSRGDYTLGGIERYALVQTLVRPMGPANTIGTSGDSLQVSFSGNTAMFFYTRYQF